MTRESSSSSGANKKVIDIRIQDDGKILVIGDFTKLRDQKRYGFGRLNPDGSLDTTFNIQTNRTITAFALQKDGKILIGGYFTIVDNQACIKMGRLYQDGRLDTSFNPFAKYVNDQDLAGIRRIELGLDSQIFCIKSGNFANPINWMTPDGKQLTPIEFLPILEEETLGRVIELRNFDIRAFVLQDDGMVILGGAIFELFKKPQDNIVRFNADHSIDNNYNPGVGNSYIMTLTLQADGKLLVSGSLERISGVHQKLGIFNETMVRLNPNGTLDDSFTIKCHDRIHAVAIQPNGKIIIGGAFKKINGSPCKYIGRLNPDGSTDTTFDSEANKPVLSLALQPDGKIVIGGDFTEICGKNHERIARINPNGTIDDSFQ